MNKTTVSISIAIVLSGVLLATAAFNANACGESRFHSGAGMRYRAFITRQPANILIYRPELPANDLAQKQLDDGLERAGHRVTLVTNDSALTQALATQRYDVIIAGAHGMDVVAAQLGKTFDQSVHLAVLDPNTDKDSAVRARYPHCVSDRADLNQYLKLIEQNMQSRRT